MTLFRRSAAPSASDSRALASIAATLRAVALIGGAAALLWLLGSFTLVLFTSVLVGLLLRGLAESLARLTHLPTRAALAVVTIGLLGTVAVGGYYDGPTFVAEMQKLVQRLIPEVHALQQRYGGTFWGHYLIHALPVSGSGGGGALSALDTTFGIAATGLVVLLAAIYIAAAPSTYVSGMVRLFPLDARPRVASVLRDCGQTLQWWMLGQGIDMLAVGAISTVGLLVLGVPLPFALGILAGALTFIPYFGAWLGSVPAVLMAFTVSPVTALWTIGLFLLCHLVEGYVLAPLVQRRTAHLPPALTLLSMSLLGSFYGALGLVLATPIAAVAMVAVAEGYLGPVLGDPEAEAEAEAEASS